MKSPGRGVPSIRLACGRIWGIFFLAVWCKRAQHAQGTATSRWPGLICVRTLAEQASERAVSSSPPWLLLHAPASSPLPDDGLSPVRLSLGFGRGVHHGSRNQTGASGLRISISACSTISQPNCGPFGKEVSLVVAGDSLF